MFRAFRPTALIIILSGRIPHGKAQLPSSTGVESQVVSLWNANDSSTGPLMRTFYSELGRGTGRAEALRRAKLQLLRQPQFAHPYYWAAFIPAGDWRPLDKNTIRPQRRAS